MKVIAGLGNPGAEYVCTPHNIGFEVLDALAQGWACTLRRRLRFQARLGAAEWGGQSLLLVKPETYMNNSGMALAAVMRYHGLEAADLIVIVDDADLPSGVLRIRAHGSAGGHRGLLSVIQCLGRDDFSRVRIGIGRGSDGTGLVEHVLRPVRGAAATPLRAAVDEACAATRCIVELGVAEAMNRFNGRQKAPGATPQSEQQEAEH